MRADLIRVPCGALALLSLVFFLYGMTKLARLEDAKPSVQLDVPGVEVVKVATPDAQVARDYATSILVASGFVFLASLSVFGLTTWKARARQTG